MKTNIETDTQVYEQPSTEFLADMRQRLSALPRDLFERVHADLMDQSPQSGESRAAQASPPAGSGGVPPQSAATATPPDSDKLSGLQSPASSIMDPASLLTDLRDLITRFVVLPEFAAEALALWVVHTYAFTLREVTTYIGVVSPEKRCGKTTLLELLGFLAHEALAAANISPSALFRVIEETQPTLLIDEADTFLQARDEMAGILNAGYRKSNSYVVRVAEGKPRRQTGLRDGWMNGLVEDKSTPEATSQSHVDAPPPPSIHPSGLVRYSCWCPKVMAAIGRLPDTLADRCIVITK